MKRFGAFLLAVVSAGPVLASLDGGPWGDDRAEVAVYDTHRVVDGVPVDYREMVSVRREDVRMDALVRVDKKPRDVEVARAYEMTSQQRFEGKNVPVSVLTSVFVRAKDPASVVKISVGAQDLSGNIFKLFTNAGGAAGRLLIHSYRDGEADRSLPVETQPGDYFEDALPLSLRDLNFRPGLEIKGRLWTTMADNQGAAPEAVPVTIQVLDEDLIRAHAGSLNCWKVSVTPAGGAPDTFWFEKAAPHILVRMAKSDGTTRQLYGRARWAHWDRRFPRPFALN